MARMPQRGCKRRSCNRLHLREFPHKYQPGECHEWNWNGFERQHRWQSSLCQPNELMDENHLTHQDTMRLTRTRHDPSSFKIIFSGCVDAPCVGIPDLSRRWKLMEADLIPCSPSRKRFATSAFRTGRASEFEIDIGAGASSRCAIE